VLDLENRKKEMASEIDGQGKRENSLEKRLKPEAVFECGRNCVWNEGYVKRDTFI